MLIHFIRSRSVLLRWLPGRSLGTSHHRCRVCQYAPAPSAGTPQLCLPARGPQLWQLHTMPPQTHSPKQPFFSLSSKEWHEDKNCQFWGLLHWQPKLNIDSWRWNVKKTPHSKKPSTECGQCHTVRNEFCMKSPDRNSHRNKVSNSYGQVENSW